MLENKKSSISNFALPDDWVSYPEPVVFICEFWIVFPYL